MACQERQRLSATRGVWLTVGALAFALLTAQPALVWAHGAVEAERMHLGSATGHVVRDRAASGRRALLLSGRGWARIRVSVTAPSRLTVVARARRCAGVPGLAATIDGRRAFSRPIRTARFAPRSSSGTVAPGQHTVRLGLANPHRGVRCRRGVRVDRLLLAPPPGVPSPGARWRPAPDTTWQWQLTGPLDL